MDSNYYGSNFIRSQQWLFWVTFFVDTIGWVKIESRETSVFSSSFIIKVFPWNMYYYEIGNKEEFEHLARVLEPPAPVEALHRYVQVGLKLKLVGGQVLMDQISFHWKTTFELNINDLISDKNNINHCFLQSLS